MTAAFSLVLAVWLGSLDQSIANTLLPAIANELQTTPAESVIVIHAYQLAVVATLLPLASLGDRWGARRIFLYGIGLSSIAAIGSFLAPNLFTLGLFRMIQGIGASGIMSVNLALIRQLFSPEKLGRGTGLNAFAVGMGYSLGPTLATVALGYVSWRWLLGMQFPIGILCWYLAYKHLPLTSREASNPSNTQPSYSPTLAALTAVCFASLIWSLGAIAQMKSLFIIVVAVFLMMITGGWTLKLQRQLSIFMLPVDLMQRPMFRLSVFTSLSSFTTQGIAFVALPFFLLHELHRAPFEAGILMTTWSIVVAFSAPVAGPLSDKYPPAILGGIGLTCLSIGMWTLSGTTEQDSLPIMAGCIALCGIGFGFFQSPNLRAIMTSAPPHRASGASAMVALARLTGQASGAAMVAICFNLFSETGPSTAIALGALTAGIGAIISFARLKAH
jgi:MFS transporter, DHA2 family, multidrug resistance protein